MGTKQPGTKSRLLVKMATGIDVFGEEGFEEKIDTLLSQEKKRPAKKIKLVDIRITTILRIIGAELSLPVERVKDGTSGEEEKFALSLAVYFIKIKLQLSNSDIAGYFGRKSHSFVNDYSNYVSDIYRHRQASIKKIELLIENKLSRK